MTTDLDVAAIAIAIATVAASAQRITDAMMAKGLGQPLAQYTIGMDGAQCILLGYKIGTETKGHYVYDFQRQPDQTLEGVALAWIAEQPDAANRNRAEFLRLAAAAADFAAKTPDIGADPDLEAIRAGITATMRKLSENAIAGPSK